MKKVLMEIIFDSNDFEKIEKNIDMLLDYESEIDVKNWNIILCEDIKELTNESI